jgi:hypothetical protein
LRLQSVEREVKKVRTGLERFKDLSDKSLPSFEKPFAKQFNRDLIEKVYENAKSSLSETSKIIDPLNEQDALLKLARIENIINSVYYTLNEFFENYLRFVKTSRNIYDLASWFLSHFKDAPSYIILQGTQISMISFSEMMHQFRIEQHWPEFWTKIENLEFYFIFMPPEFSNPSESLIWILLLHELSHVLIISKKVLLNVPYYLSEVPQKGREFFFHELVRLAGDPYAPLREYAERKLHVIECAADTLPTSVVGPAFGWCAAKNLRYKDVLFPAITHPKMSERLMLIAEQVKKQGFDRESRLIIQALVDQLEYLGTYGGKTKEEIQSELNDGLEEVKRIPHLHDVLDNTLKLAGKNFTKNDLKTLLPGTSPKNLGQKVESIAKEFIRGNITVVDPGIIYNIFSSIDLESKCREVAGEFNFTEDEIQKHKSTVQELIADCIRLYAVKSRVSG